MQITYVYFSRFWELQIHPKTSMYYSMLLSFMAYIMPYRIIFQMQLGRKSP